jgi:Predicted endonuclease distantly related to archaeal Holliday junction resolvase
MRATDALGRRGEDLAAAHLNDLGLVILERNYRSRAGELDIIARDGDVLVICEVKTRSTEHFGHPLAAVDHRKLRRMRRVALDWVSERGVRPGSIRFDVIGILDGASGSLTLEHLRGVD